MLTEIPKETYFEERSVFREVIKVCPTWFFDSEYDSGEDVPSWVIVGVLHEKILIHHLLIIPGLIGYKCPLLFVELALMEILIFIYT